MKMRSRKFNQRLGELIGPFTSGRLYNMLHARRLEFELLIPSPWNHFRELQKQNDDVSHQLGKKEKECELRTQEKEEMVDTVSKMKLKLERETNSHTETQQNLSDLSAHFHHLKGQLETEKNERQRLEVLFKSGNIPDDAKVKLSGEN